MTLAFDGQAEVVSPARRRDAAGAPSASPHHMVLSPAMVADLQLALAGVLPPGQLLGGPIDPPATGQVAVPHPTPAGGVSLRIPSQDVELGALAAGSLQLWDEEGTPLAVLEGLAVANGSGHTLSGQLRRIRQRECRAASHLEVNFDAPRLRNRPLLVMARPATLADLSVLATWAGDHPAPLVLVAEQAARHDRVPTATLLRLADALLSDLGVSGAQLLTVPLECRDATSDLQLARRVAARLDAVDLRVLLDDAPGPSAAVWSRTRTALNGNTRPTLAEFPLATREVLAAWRPPRSRRGLVLMFTGFSGSGKSTLARDVTEWITSNTSRTVSLLDGDRVRQLLSAGLGFDEASREINVRRIGYVAAEVATHGGIAICSAIAPSARTRSEVRVMAEQSGDFVLVHVSTPIEECERRDLKGLYAAARQGTVAHFTGISSPYDVPTDADLAVDTSRVERLEAARLVVDLLIHGGWVKGSGS